MKRFTSKANDERIAADVNDLGTLRCQADRCPNRWSVSHEIGEGARGLCSRHARIDPSLWPAVTQSILDDMAEDARRLAAAPPKRPSGPPSKADRERLIAELRKLATPDTQGPRDWAYRLKARDEAGEHLSIAQRECYRTALRSHLDPDPS
jgi:hypothetical protein